MWSGGKYSIAYAIEYLTNGQFIDKLLVGIGGGKSELFSDKWRGDFFDKVYCKVSVLKCK